MGFNHHDVKGQLTIISVFINLEVYILSIKLSKAMKNYRQLKGIKTLKAVNIEN